MAAVYVINTQTRDGAGALLCIFLKLIASFSSLISRLITFTRSMRASLLAWFNSLPQFYQTNERMWQDGFLVDFLQKKFLNDFMCGFLIYSSYLFSERVLFDWVSRFFIDLVIWPSTLYSPFEAPSAATLLKLTILLFVLFLCLINLTHLHLLLFGALAL